VTVAQDVGKVVSLTHRRLFTRRKCSWYSFLLEVFQMISRCIDICASSHGGLNGFSICTENCPPFVRDPWKYEINKDDLKEQMS